MDSGGTTIEVVLGTEFSDYDRRTEDNKTVGLKTGAGSSHGKSVQAPIRFVILYSVYDSLGRLAIRLNGSPSPSKTCPRAYQLSLTHIFILAPEVTVLALIIHLIPKAIILYYDWRDKR